MMRKSHLLLAAPLLAGLAACNPFAGSGNDQPAPTATVVGESAAPAATPAAAPATPAATTGDGKGGEASTSTTTTASNSATTDGKGSPTSSGGACTDGRNRHVMVINETRTTLRELYGSNVNRTTWEEDVLGSRVLPAGERIDVNWDDGTCMCDFDLKAVFVDGEEVVRRQFNVCTESAWRIVE